VKKTGKKAHRWVGYLLLVALVDSGPAALQTMYDAVTNKKPYTIALIDMQMPGMDGAKLGEMIKSEQQFSEVSLALITSQGQRGDAEKIHKKGFSAYLSKPIHQFDFYNALLQLSDNEEAVSEVLITRYTAREQQPKFRARVLVVDDNNINQLVAKGMLEKFEINVDLANNGQEAVDCLQHTDYDLVFMDCQMPVMDGYTATKTIREPQSSVKNHSIPIVAMTANAMQGDKDKCLASGMDDFIAKPVDIQKLRNILQKWLDTDVTETAIADSVQQIKAVVIIENEVLVFDYAAMSERLMNDKELIEIIANTFLEDIPEQIDQLKVLAETGDAEQVGAQAHKIKGAALNVGAMAFSVLALKIEQAGKNANMQVVRQHLSLIDETFSQIHQAMKETI